MVYKSHDDKIRTHDVVGLMIAATMFAGCVLWIALAPAQSEYEMVSVVVRPGDTLWGLARQYAPDMDPREAVYIIRVNNGELDPARLQPGDIVLVPQVQ